MLVGSVLLTAAAATPVAALESCTPLRERWPREDELVTGNDRDLILTTARAIMERVGHAALVTIDDGHLPRVRSVGTRAPEDDFTVWAMTHEVSRKVVQIRARPEVALHYVDGERAAQVTLMGTAEVVSDAATLRAKNFFSDDQVREYWPGYPAHYVLIAVRPLWLEISAPGSSIRGDQARWRPAGLRF